jgi:hypothetical protein
MSTMTPSALRVNFLPKSSGFCTRTIGVRLILQTSSCRLERTAVSYNLRSKVEQRCNLDLGDSQTDVSTIDSSSRSESSKNISSTSRATTYLD